ncbi:MAG: hypothetical protein AMXMBFR84_34400 [Candidatus Hydrogenedentota bacterium]
MSIFSLVSHNVFWFQGSPFAPEQPGMPDPAIMLDLLRLYQVHSPDVYCLQEIQDIVCFDLLRKHLAMNGAFCSGRKRPQYGGAIFWSHGRHISDSSGHEPAPHRMWQVAEVMTRGNPIIRLANVHLTSARYLAQDEAAIERVAEIESLLKAGEVDIVAGDFNEGPRLGVALRLEAAGYVDAAVVSGVSLESTGVGKSRSDQIWLRGDWASHVESFGYVDWDELRISGNSAKTFQAKGNHAGHLSDHLPLWLKLAF